MTDLTNAQLLHAYPEIAADEREVLDSVRARGGSLLDAIRESRGESVTDEERFRMRQEREEAARRRTLAGLRYDSWLRSGSEDRLSRIERNLDALTGTLAASAQMRARVAPPTESRRAEEPPASSGQGAVNRPAEARPTPPDQDRSPARVPLTDDVLRKGLEQA